MPADVVLVWIHTPAGGPPIVCGSLKLLPRSSKVAFFYDEGYLKRPDAFSLAPDLPLRTGLFEPSHHLDIHPVFEDAGPDAWGREVINRIHAPTRRSLMDYLVLSGSDAMGALAFSWPAASLHPASPSRLESLESLLQAIEKIENRQDISPEQALLLRPGTSLGGMRPKSSVKINGVDWIAKFPSRQDEIDTCALEYGFMRLAGECSIDVPDVRLVNCKDVHVLLVQRFDRTVNGERLQFLSAKTLLESNGISTYSYADLAQLIRKDSPSPVEDAENLFRRLIFNIAIENGDDHERNHGFLRKGNCFALSPAYDMSPQLQNTGYQSLVIDQGSMESSIALAIASAGHFRLDQRESVRIATEVIETVANRWRSILSESGLDDFAISVVSRFVQPRIEQAKSDLAVSAGYRERPA